MTTTPRLSFFLALATAGVLTSSATLLAAQDGNDVPGVGEPGGPGRVLAPAEMEQWLRGRELFDLSFHRSRGLGAPEMNANSCRACHQDPVLGGSGALELNVSRFAHDNGGAGPYMDLPGGQGLSKLRPPYVFGREEYDETLADVFEQRQTPSLLGGGLIDTIPDAVITANEDPTDSDMDGIHGVARHLMINGVEEIGRFGWKAQVPHVVDFVRDAMGGELGITTPVDGRGFAMAADADTTPDPELTLAEVDDLAFFLTELGPPLRKNPTSPVVLQGEALFASTGCATCHVPELMGTGGPVPLYSNLLVHDVMDSSYRGMSEPGAGVGFFRTPPLWGIGETAPYMHDGRAETLLDAISAHHGEAQNVRDDFLALPGADRNALLAFLRDL